MSVVMQLRNVATVETKGEFNFFLPCGTIVTGRGTQKRGTVFYDQS